MGGANKQPQYTMLSNHKPRIETFPRRVDSVETIVGVDLQLEDEIPIEELAWVNALRVSTPADDDASEAGGNFPAQSGYDIEKKLFLPLADKEQKNAVLVGSVSTLSSAEWFIYSREPIAEDLAKAIEDKFGDLEVASRAQHDPAWSVYREFLLPSRIERLLIQNRRAVRELAELGKSSDEPRICHHTIWFTSPDDRNAFAELVAEEGFELHYPEQDVNLKATEEDIEYGLTVTRPERIDIEALDNLVHRMFKRASRFGGEYEGWHVQH